MGYIYASGGGLGGEGGRSCGGEEDISLQNMMQQSLDCV
jgi:hypothetical protein